MNIFVFVYALYAYLNKGIAYAFLAEVLLVLGLFIFLFRLKDRTLIVNTPIKIILFFICITAISVVAGLGRFPIRDLIQDGFMFFYALFIPVVFLFIPELEMFTSKIIAVYRWYPVVVVVNFLLVSYVPFFQQFVLFGNIPLMLYKFGDMGVHLLITTLLLLCGHITMSRKWMVVYITLIAYIFLLVATYNRAGMLAYLVGLFIFLWVYRKRFSGATLWSYLKWLPILLVLVLGIYSSTRVQENFQGRKVGISQLKENFTSIFSSDAEGSLSDNKLWRLAWWYKILVDATEPRNAIFGKGVGVNLTETNEIKVDEENLRSPHNFHLNILARFGVIVFVLWIGWIVMHMKQIRSKGTEEFHVMILVFMAAFLINATFDVYLEGPMGAFPFWMWVGVLYGATYDGEPQDRGALP